MVVTTDGDMTGFGPPAGAAPACCGAIGNGGGGALIGFEPACGVCGRNAELTPLLLLLLVGFTGCGPRANGIAFDPCPTGGGGGTAAGGGGGGGRLP